MHLSPAITSVSASLLFRRLQCGWINGYVMEHVEKRSVNNFKRSVSIGDGKRDVNKPPRDCTFQRAFASVRTVSPRALSTGSEKLSSFLLERGWLEPKYMTVV